MEHGNAILSESIFPVTWKEFFTREDVVSELKRIAARLKEEPDDVKIFPPPELMFNAFLQTTPEDVKVVLIGQDPYIRPGQAHGLSFSVLPPTPPPPSLRNIYTELEAEGFSVGDKNRGDLTKWAREGVMMLNTALTVREGDSNSHKDVWKTFGRMVVRYINEKCRGVVFVLWGNYAKSYAQMVDLGRNYIVQGIHPSPLSAYRGFFGCGHFRTCNEMLEHSGRSPVNWNL